MSSCRFDFKYTPEMCVVESFAISMSSWTVFFWLRVRGELVDEINWKGEVDWAQNPFDLSSPVQVGPIIFLKAHKNLGLIHSVDGLLKYYWARIIHVYSCCLRDYCRCEIMIGYAEEEFYNRITSLHCHIYLKQVH